MSDTLDVGPHIKIPSREFLWSYARGSGPGGQNVNKVSSKAILTWQVAGSPSLPVGVRQRFLAKFQSKILDDGTIQIASDKFRDQKRNVDDCLAKLAAMIEDVLTPPKPRKKTKPTRGAVERRLAEKKAQSARKSSRKHKAEW
jgi:ribosome-associated protein